MIEITTTDVEKFRRDMEEAKSKLPRQFYLALQRATRLVQTRSREEYLSGPRPRRLGVVSGDLRRSIKTAVFMRGSEGAGAVFSRLTYAPVHEFGARIRAKRGKYLRFRTRDGLWHRVSEVVIPARPFLRTALRDCRSQIEELFADAIQKTLRGG